MFCKEYRVNINAEQPGLGEWCNGRTRMPHNILVNQWIELISSDVASVLLRWSPNEKPTKIGGLFFHSTIQPFLCPHRKDNQVKQCREKWTLALECVKKYYCNSIVVMMKGHALLRWLNKLGSVGKKNIYIWLYICVCVCVYFSILQLNKWSCFLLAGYFQCLVSWAKS